MHNSLAHQQASLGRGSMLSESKFRKAKQAVQPNLMYLQGQQLENEEEIGCYVIRCGGSISIRSSCSNAFAGFNGCGSVVFFCSTMPHFPSSSWVKCTMLAVLCGKVGKQRTPPGPMPESQRLWPSFPFPELISSGSGGISIRSSYSYMALQFLHSIDKAWIGFFSFARTKMKMKLLEMIYIPICQMKQNKSLVPLGIACVDGTLVCSFNRQGVGPLLFFCTNQDENEDIENDLYSDLPRWSASLEKDRVKGSIGSKPARQIGYKGSDNVEWGKGGVDAKNGGWTCGSRGGGRKMKSSRTSSARRRSIASVHQEDPSAASSSKTPTTNGRPRPLSQKPPCALAPHRVGRYSAARVLALHEDGRLVILLPVTNISSHSAASSPSPRTASPLPTCSPEEEVKETAGEKGILRRIRSRIALEVDAAEKPQKQQQQIIKAERLRICGVVCSTMPHFPSGSRVKCTMLAVLCGKVGKQRMPPDPLPESQRPRPSFPFQELISSGRLDVHTLINPTVDQFLEAQRALQPRFMYFQGQQLDKEEEIGRLVWGDADVSDPQIFSSLICPPFPTIVYLEVPSGEKIAQSLQSKDSSILNSLEDGLNALLNIEFRWCKLQDRVSAAPPLHCDSTLLDGVVTICCDITTSSSSHVSLLLSGSPQTCFDDKLLEKHIKKELIESRRLVRVVSVSEDDRPSSAEPLTSMSVASGASTFEVLMTLPKWAAQVLKYLAQETSYKSLVPLGIASVNGTPVSSFDRQDVDRLLFFCTNQDEDEAIANGLYHHPPRWSASLAKDRVKANMVNESSPRSSSPSSSSSSSSPRGEEEAQEGSSRSCGFRFRARLLFDPRTGSGDLSFMNDLLLLVVLQGSMVE
uniref:Uncharacterized protein n=1 Tax=Oryza glumipatula TaxID=40148 RepID=A0A0E0AW54_9ORYZ